MPIHKMAVYCIARMSCVRESLDKFTDTIYKAHLKGEIAFKRIKQKIP